MTSVRTKTSVLVLSLALVVFGLEFTYGRWVERREVERAASRDLQDPLTSFKAPPGAFPLSEKPAGVKRIVYLSNSHARTGGNVARHLQKMLAHLSPGSFQVLDFSDPGIFAPDMLQRFAASLEWKPDLLILPVAYISFSDRMKLRRQSHTARSFFRPEVFSRLPLGFWLRNYDIGLFLDSLVSSTLNLHRYRSALRDLWELPLARELHALFGPTPIHSLEVSETRDWQFPTGFDRNLFNWRLYAQGRSGHLDDYEALIELAKRNGVSVFAANLPIDWQKSPHAVTRHDLGLYRMGLEEASFDADSFVDYEDLFPKRFTTYDPLHPTYSGARLHALDLVLRLQERGVLHTDSSSIEEAFTLLGAEWLGAFRTKIQGERPAKLERRFLRVDLTDQDAAFELLEALRAAKLGSAEERKLLERIALRLRFYRETDFRCGALWKGHSVNDLLWEELCRVEIERAGEAREEFARELLVVQGKRLRHLPLLLSGSDESPVAEKSLTVAGQSVRERKYQRGGVAFLTYAREGESRVFASIVLPDGKPPYARIDLFGDGSFVALTHPSQFFVPRWVYESEPFSQWGVS